MGSSNTSVGISSTSFNAAVKMIKKQKWLEEPGCLRLPVSAALTPQTGSPDLRPAQRERRKQTGPGPRSQRLVTFLKRKKEKKAVLLGAGRAARATHARALCSPNHPSSQANSHAVGGAPANQAKQLPDSGVKFPVKKSTDGEHGGYLPNLSPHPTVSLFFGGGKTPPRPQSRTHNHQDFLTM